MFDFTGKACLITGAASGIGRATSEHFAAAGAQVAIADLSLEACQVVVDHLVAQSHQALAIECDVRNLKDCESMIEQTLEAFGKLDVVFCNAGIFRPGNIEEQTVEEWDLQIDTMLKGTFFTCRAAIPALRKNKGGAIILSGSNCAHVGCSGRFAYTAAKSCMPTLAKQLSNDYYHSVGIRVNCVSPGLVHSNMTETVWKKQNNYPLDQPLPDHVIEQWQDASAIAYAVMFLASEKFAGDITGVTIPVSRTALTRVAVPRMM